MTPFEAAHIWQEAAPQLREILIREECPQEKADWIMEDLQPRILAILEAGGVAIFSEPFVPTFQQLLGLEVDLYYARLGDGGGDGGSRVTSDQLKASLSNVVLLRAA